MIEDDHRRAIKMLLRDVSSFSKVNHNWTASMNWVLDHGSERDEGRWSDDEWACIRMAYLLLKERHVTQIVKPRMAGRMIGALCDWHNLRIDDAGRR